jgi:hypothetical protein
LRPKRILVADAHVPFVTGGAELHVRSLIEVLRHRGHDADLVALPFRSQPKEELLAQAAAWRLLDLSSSNGQPIDLLIATRFPTYFARHPHKVAWVIHQHRAAYELCGTPYSEFEHTEADVGLRKRLFELDARMLGECRHVFANSNNTCATAADVQRCRRRGACTIHRHWPIDCGPDPTATTRSSSAGSRA